MKSFIFGGNTGLSYEELQRQQDIADQLASRVGDGSSLGAGASSFGAAIGYHIANNKAKKGMRAGREAFNSQFDNFITGRSPAQSGFANSSALAARPPSPAPSTARPIFPSDGMRPSDQPQTVSNDNRAPVAQSAIAQALGGRADPTATPSAPIQTASLSPQSGFAAAQQEPAPPPQSLRALQNHAQSGGQLPDPNAPTGHEGHNHGAAGSESFIAYHNQNATRNKPLSEKLVGAMSFLPEMGVEMRVISGGQDAKGEGTRRTGSTRHDHGNSADADFYKDGRKLDWNNPEDLPILAEIVKRSRANGVTGIGAGDDYMGAGRMHIGFGRESVWGAGGKAANAPSWLREAYNTPLQGGDTPVVAQPVQRRNSALQRPAQVAQAQGLAGVDPELLRMAQNPYATDVQKNMINSMIQQQVAQNAPPSAAQQLAERKFQLEQRRFELEQGNAVAKQNAPIQVDGRLVDPNTFQPVYEAPQKPTGTIQEYNFYKSQEEAAGRQPLPFNQYQVSIKKAGANNVNVNSGSEVGTIPKGWEMITDPQSGARRLRPIAGGQAEIDQKKAAEQKIIAKDSKALSGNVVLEDIDRALAGLDEGSLPTSGALGGAMSQIPGTQAFDVKSLITTISANSGFDRLQAMRDASPTGGALGAINKSEMDLLQAALGNLSQYQSADQLKFNLNRVKDIYNSIINGTPNSSGGGNQPEANQPDADGWKTLPNGVRMRVKK